MVTDRRRSARAGRNGTLTAAGAGIVLVCATTMAATAAPAGHRHRAVPRVVIPAPYRGPVPVTYRLNPYAYHRWDFPGLSITFGDAGSEPMYYSYPYVWSHSGNPADLACNMPSSPCWNQDRE